jgi:arylsulfatase A-like enzyme
MQGAVRYVDASIGRILTRLRELQLEQNTVVVFTTDHGLSMPRAKMTLFDPGLETALIVRFPQRGWEGGRVVDELVSNVDVFPTLIDAVGLPIPDRIDGQSVAPLLDGEKVGGRSEIFAQQTYHCYYEPSRAIRTERHKLVLRFSPGYSFMIEPIWRHRVTATVPWSIASSVVEFYDLSNDPAEMIDLASTGDQVEVRTGLLERLHAWMRDISDPILSGPIPTPFHAAAMSALVANGGTLPRD